MGYMVELRKADGELVAVLERAYNVSLTQRINESDIISFSLPADDPKTTHLLLSNEVWLIDTDTMSPISKGIMYVKEDMRA